MGKSKPEPVKAPLQQQQQQTNTYDRFSIADSDEAKEFLGLPLNFGGGNYGGDAYKDIKTDFNLDPGVGRRTALAEQEAGQRAESAFSFGVPRFLRQANQAKELRDIQSQGAYEAQQAEYGKQQAEYQSSVERARMRDEAEKTKARMGDEATTQRTMAELERRRLLLPQYLQTGGSGSSSGYNTQIVQPQPGFWQRAALGAIGGATGALSGRFLG